MSKYLEYFNGAFDDSIVEKIKPENRPYVGYSKEEERVVYSNPLPKYLCFEPIDENGNQLAVAKLANWCNTQYSFDKVTWTEFPTNPSNPLNPVFITVDKPIYLKGNNPKGYTNFETMEGSKIIGIGKYNVSGDVTTLLNEVGNVKDLSDCYPGCLACLFGELDRSDIGVNVPAIDIVDASKLILPATTLANYCYYSMFESCTSLVTAPSILPATELVPYCYSHMFGGCTSLTTAPELPATELAKECYAYMFSGCTSLTTAQSILPATTLTGGCCQGMFSGTSLTIAPELPATELAERCYSDMFYGCTSLTTVPSILPATELAEYCYFDMFYGCTTLTTAPELPATELAKECYGQMFCNCDSLITAPKLPATELAEGCYSHMFSGCDSLTTAPSILPATELADSCYRGMFSGCDSLTTAPELPATELADSCYRDMFSGCDSLTTAPELPATTLAHSCYRGMFEYCTSLTTAPDLPATELVLSCYYEMFYNCTKLNYIKCLATNYTPTNTPINNYYTGIWVQGVSSTGIFVKHPNTTWSTGESGIPSSWTVEDAVL